MCLVLSATVSTGTGILYILTHKRGLWCYESALNYFFVYRNPLKINSFYYYTARPTVRESRRDCRIMKTFLPFPLILDSHLRHVEPIHWETHVYWSNLWNCIFSFIEQLEKNLQDNFLFVLFFLPFPPITSFFSQMKQTNKQSRKCCQLK